MANRQPAVSVPIASKTKRETRTLSMNSFKFLDTAAAILFPAITMLLVLAVWELGVRMSGVSSLILPAPSAILATIWTRRILFLTFSQATILEVLGGFLLAMVVGIALGMLMFFSSAAKRALYPLFVASQMVPKVAIAPVLVIWFGTDMTPKVLISFLIAFFPIMISTTVGLASTDPDMVTLFRSMGANGIRIFTKLRLPGALPNVFAGLKIGMSLAVVGAIVGEFVAADRGLGYFLLYANGQFDTVGVFASMIVLTVIGVGLYFIIELIQYAFIPKGIRKASQLMQGTM